MDLEALAWHVDTHLGPDPEPEGCRRTFYTLANVRSQLTGGELTLLEIDF